MRQKTRNTLFTIFYPGRYPGAALPAPDDAVSVAVTDSGEFVSICTKDGCAVFHTAKELRELANVLYEAADLFDENQAKPKARTP